MVQKTDKQIAQRQLRGELATKARIGTKIYNNGVVSKRFKEDPGEGWVLGDITVSKEQRMKRAAASSEKCKGKMTINNGIRCQFWDKNVPLPDGWAAGMIPRNKTPYFFINVDTKETMKKIGDKTPDDGYRRMTKAEIEKFLCQSTMN